MVVKSPLRLKIEAINRLGQVIQAFIDDCHKVLVRHGLVEEHPERLVRKLRLGLAARLGARAHEELAAPDGEA